MEGLGGSPGRPGDEGHLASFIPHCWLEGSLYRHCSCLSAVSNAEILIRFFTWSHFPSLSPWKLIKIHFGVWPIAA